MAIYNTMENPFHVQSSRHHQSDVLTCLDDYVAWMWWMWTTGHGDATVDVVDMVMVVVMVEDK